MLRGEYIPLLSPLLASQLVEEDCEQGIGAVEVATEAIEGDLILAQDNLYHLPADTSALAEFMTSTMAQFEASVGNVVFDKELGSYGAYQASTSIIFLETGANAATMTEELYHFVQVQQGLNQYWSAVMLDRNARAFLIDQLGFTPID